MRWHDCLMNKSWPIFISLFDNFNQMFYEKLSGKKLPWPFLFHYLRILPICSGVPFISQATPTIQNNTDRKKNITFAERRKAGRASDKKTFPTPPELKICHSLRYINERKHREGPRVSNRKQSDNKTKF